MLDTIENAIEEIKAGRLVIVVDDEERENEGDFVTAAKNITPEVINFMSKHGRGLICAPTRNSATVTMLIAIWAGERCAIQSMTAFFGRRCTLSETTSVSKSHFTVHPLRTEIGTWQEISSGIVVTRDPRPGTSSIAR